MNIEDGNLKLDHIQIGTVNYSIEYKSLNDIQADLHSSSNLFGSSDPMAGRILINNDACEDQKIDTLFHEMVHCILGGLGYDDVSSNEVLVESVGQYVLNILKDNPKLIDEIKGDKHDKRSKK